MADVKILQSKKDGSLWADLPGGQLQPVTQEQAALIRENPGTLSNIVGSAVETGKQALLGLASFGPDAELAQAPLQRSREETAARGMVSPISTMAGQAAPALAVGAATMGAGLPVTVGTEALMGAAMMPEEPLVGAAIGGAFGAVPFAAPAAVRGVQAAARMAGEAGQQFPVPGLPMSGAMPGQGGRMADRVMGRIDAAAPEAPPVRYLEGLPTSQEWDAAGMPLMPSQRLAFDATEAQMPLAKQVRWAENIRGGNQDVAVQQRMGFTNMVKQEMGVTDPVGLTPVVIGRTLAKEGERIGELTASGGPVRFADDALASIKQVVADADTTHASVLNNVLKDLEASMKRNGGAVSPEDFTRINRRLGDMIERGTNSPTGSGKVMDAAAIKDVMEDALTNSLTAGAREELRQARYRYKIASTLLKGKSVGSDGMVNAATFGSNWDRTLSKKLRGQDNLGRWADAVDYAQRLEANAGTTLQRVFANAPGVAAKAAPGAIGAALGVGGLNQLFGGM